MQASENKRQSLQTSEQEEKGREEKMKSRFRKQAVIILALTMIFANLSGPAAFAEADSGRSAAVKLAAGAEKEESGGAATPSSVIRTEEGVLPDGAVTSGATPSELKTLGAPPPAIDYTLKLNNGFYNGKTGALLTPSEKSSLGLSYDSGKYVFNDTNFRTSQLTGIEIVGSGSLYFKGHCYLTVADTTDKSQTSYGIHAGSNGADVVIDGDEGSALTINCGATEQDRCQGYGIFVNGSLDYKNVATEIVFPEEGKIHGIGIDIGYTPSFSNSGMTVSSGEINIGVSTAGIFDMGIKGLKISGGTVEIDSYSARPESNDAVFSFNGPVEISAGTLRADSVKSYKGISVSGTGYLETDGRGLTCSNSEIKVRDSGKIRACSDAAGSSPVYLSDGKARIDGDLKGSAVYHDTGTLKEAFFGYGKIYADSTVAKTVEITKPSGNIFTVLPDPGPGTCSEKSLKTGTDGKLATLPVPVLTGYQFDAWYLRYDDKADGKFIKVDTSTVFTSNAIITAKYTKEYCIKLFENGGTVLSPDTVYADAFTGKLETALPVPVRPGYVFNGWFDAVEGGTQYTSGSTFTGDMNLFAHWSEIVYGVHTVTLNPDGGTVTPAALTTDAYGKLAASLPTPAKSGYIFTGWYDGAGNLCRNSTVFTADMILVAKWTKDSGGSPGGGGSSGGGGGSGGGGSSGGSRGSGSGSGFNGPEGNHPVSVTGNWHTNGDGSWGFTLVSGEEKTSGWIYTGNSWYHFDENGRMNTGWVSGSDGWYFVNRTPGAEEGKLLYGWQMDTDGNWYYLDPATGKMVCGWIKSPASGKWYYLNTSTMAESGIPNGAMLHGQKTPDEYNLNEDGSLAE
jgi:uncharacterized repeat protein (TIGR02543 family)